jgi:hypothetical protein
MPHWLALHDDKQMEAMKKLLQKFLLVYSDNEGGIMEWDSDMIVPAFWQTKMPAAWLFLGDILRINKSLSCEGEAVRVHWSITSSLVCLRRCLTSSWSRVYLPMSSLTLGRTGSCSRRRRSLRAARHGWP